MSTPEPVQRAERPSPLSHSRGDDSTSIKSYKDASVVTSKEYRKDSNKTYELRKTNEDAVRELTMMPLPGFYPLPSKDEANTSHVFRVKQDVASNIIDLGHGVLKFRLAGQADKAAIFQHRFPTALSDGQGNNVRLTLRGDHPGLAKIELMQPDAPFAQTISEEIQITGKEQQVSFHGIAPASPKGLLFKLQATPEVGGVNVDFLSVTQSKALTQPAHYSIVDGQVVESKNNDVSGKNSLGKTVEVRNRQPFIIGFEAQSLKLNVQSRAQQNIQEFLINNASGATVTPYWSQYQENSRAFRQKAEWLEAHGIEVKEHPALWDQMVPATDAHGKKFEINWGTIKQHVQDIARMPGQFTEINETADVNSAPDNAVTRWIKREGPARATEEAMDWAKQADPGKKVLYNDYQNGAQEIRMLDQMQKDGKLPDAIGIQLHMDQGNWPLARVEETINNLAKYGRPIYITEISVLSGAYGESLSKVNHVQIAEMSANFKAMSIGKSLDPDSKVIASLCGAAESLAPPKFKGDDVAVVAKMMKDANSISDPALRDKVVAELKSATTWADTPEGEKAQADYTVNLYKLLHSNPHVQGITWWDLSDENSWKHAPRGWFKEDGSPKLVVARMTELFKQWQKDLPPS